MSDEACAALADLLIQIGLMLPDFVTSKQQKQQLRFGHSLLTEAIRQARPQFQTYLEGMHFFMKKYGIEAKNPEPTTESYPPNIHDEGCEFC